MLRNSSGFVIKLVSKLIEIDYCYESYWYHIKWCTVKLYVIMSFRSGRNSFKVVVLGEAGVGKSSLIRRYTQGYFTERTTTTVGVDRIPLNITVDNESLLFQVLDTSGCFGFRGLIKSYMNNVDAVVFVYDLTNKESFACLPLWNTILKASGKTDITKILVGNKRDLSDKREVKFRNAKNYAEFEGMVAMEISVKEEDSVDLVFQCIARELKLKRQIEENEIRNKNTKKHSTFFKPSSNAKVKNQETKATFAQKLSLFVLGKKSSNNKKGSFTPAPKRREMLKTEPIQMERFRWD